MPDRATEPPFNSDEFGNVWDWSTTPPTFVRTTHGAAADWLAHHATVRNDAGTIVKHGPR
jgi:hypothetical protein